MYKNITILKGSVVVNNTEVFTIRAALSSSATLTAM